MDRLKELRNELEVAEKIYNANIPAGIKYNVLQKHLNDQIRKIAEHTGIGVEWPAVDDSYERECSLYIERVVVAKGYIDEICSERGISFSRG